MKAVLLGLVMLPVLAIAILSLRPGGLRRQLRHMRRRLKIAIVLGGIYVAASTAVQVLVPKTSHPEYYLGGIVAALALTFVVLAQDPVEQSR